MTTFDEIATFEVDREWIDRHMPLLVDQFADHWIAVKHECVIASEVDLGELLNKLPDLAHTCIEFINSRFVIQT
jgi:hypothetical protein